MPYFKAFARSKKKEDSLSLSTVDAEFQSQNNSNVFHLLRSIGPDLDDGGRPKPKGCCSCCCCCCRNSKPFPPSAYDLIPDLQHSSREFIAFIVEKEDEYSDRVVKLKRLPDTPPAYLKLHRALADSFENCHLTISILKNITYICKHTLEKLSYDPEDVLTGDNSKLTKDRSIIGSNLWLATRLFKDARKYDEAKQRDFDETREELEDLVGYAAINFKGGIHVVNVFIRIREAANRILKNYVDRLPTEIQNLALLKSKNKERREQIKRLKRHNKADRKNTKSPSFPEEIVVKPEPAYDSEFYSRAFIVKNETIKNTASWTPLLVGATATQSEPMSVQLLVGFINRLCIQSARILDDAHNLLQLVDQHLHVKESVEDTLQMTVDLLGSNLKLIWRQKEKLSENQSESVVKLGRILMEEMDVTEYFLMNLRALVSECRETVEVCYSYIRIFYLGNLPKYNFFTGEMLEGNDKGRDKRAQKVMRKCRMNCCCSCCQKNVDDLNGIPLNSKQIFTMYRLSPYLDILLVIPVKIDVDLLKIAIAGADGIESNWKNQPKQD